MGLSRPEPPRIELPMHNLAVFYVQSRSRAQKRTKMGESSIAVIRQPPFVTKYEQALSNCNHAAVRQSKNTGEVSRAALWCFEAAEV